MRVRYSIRASEGLLGMDAKTYCKTETCFSRSVWIRLGCSADGIADPKSDKYVAATLVKWQYAPQGFGSVASTRPNKK